MTQDAVAAVAPAAIGTASTVAPAAAAGASALAADATRTVDFLVAGQGVAGTFLARALIERGCSVLVVDDDQRDSSSRVAAGLLNPVTGMRLRLAAGTPALLETSKTFFAHLAREHGRAVFTPVPIRRLYATQREKTLKARRATEPDYAALMSPDDAPGAFAEAATFAAESAAATESASTAAASDPRNEPRETTPVSAARAAAAAPPPIADELGSFLIQGGGWVDLPLLLDLEAQWLRQRGALTSGTIHFEELQAETDARASGNGGVSGGAATSRAVRWRGVRARHGVVFCNGYKAGLEPCWRWLPWQPARGEIVDCATGIAGSPWILNRSGWAIPLGGGVWRSGSTWEWSPAAFALPPQPPLAAQLLARLQGFFRVPVRGRVVRHRAGVRPCVLGNEPLCGTHPLHPWLHLFGGLGPKGTFWGPACARHLAAHLCASVPLPSRFDLRRIPFA